MSGAVGGYRGLRQRVNNCGSHLSFHRPVHARLLQDNSLKLPLCIPHGSRDLALGDKWFDWGSKLIRPLPNATTYVRLGFEAM